MKITNIFTLLLAYMLMTTFLFGQSNYSRIEELISMLYNQQQFNGTILVAENGKITFKKSYGIANEENKKPIDENTIFELASVSKQFTAMGIVILKERGKLSYEDKLTKFFPALDEYKDVTVRNLLAHTSGLPDYINPTRLQLLDQNKINKNDDIIEFLIKQKIQLSFPPGTKFSYSNTGYVLLASIIEKVSSETYADFLKRNVFKPLNMKNTFVYNRRLAPRTLDNYAYGYGYSEKENKYVLPDNEAKFVVFLDGIVGDGNISSTALDLLKWDQALRAGKLISKQGLQELYNPAILNDGTQTKYGFGWFIGDNKDYGNYVYHSGGFPGYATYIARYLTTNKTLIILQNHHGSVIPASSITEILYNKPITKVYRKQIQLDEKRMERFIGEYRDKDDEQLVITITRGNNYLVYNSTKHQNWNLRLFPESDKSFFAKNYEFQIEFATAEKGGIEIKLFEGGKAISQAMKTRRAM
ncbi:MAG: serine hydrolase [Pyrinomonadaceae bacterium]